MKNNQSELNLITKMVQDNAYKSGYLLGIAVVKFIFEQLKSNHDELTGLLNRTGLNSQTINKDLSRYAVIYCDVNNFKKINDLFGHDKGDKFLKDFGEKLLTHYREDDLVARLGGDEFVVLVNLEQRTTQVIEDNKKIQIIEKRFVSMANELIRSQPQEYQDHNLGIAFGVVIPEANENIYDVLKKADKLMYGNKQVTKDV
jgi:diguanylate cyclase (GGDEF)-like protein